MVRRRIEIKAIEDKSKRHTTFTKRRQGLMKKTEEFCIKSEAEAAVITFSKAGNGFAFGYPRVNAVVKRYITESPSISASDLTGNSGADGIAHDDAGIEEAPPPLTVVKIRLREALENGRWDEAVRDLNLQELDEMYVEMEKIKRNVAARERDIAVMSKESEVSGVGTSRGF